MLPYKCHVRTGSGAFLFITLLLLFIYQVSFLKVELVITLGLMCEAFDIFGDTVMLLSVTHSNNPRISRMSKPFIVFFAFATLASCISMVSTIKILIRIFLYRRNQSHSWRLEKMGMQTMAEDAKSRWAVKFANGEKHKYTKAQFWQKFGVDEIFSGMSVQHEHHGVGTVESSCHDELQPKTVIELQGLLLAVSRDISRAYVAIVLLMAEDVPLGVMSGLVLWYQSSDPCAAQTFEKEHNCEMTGGSMLEWSIEPRMQGMQLISVMTSMVMAGVKLSKITRLPQLRGLKQQYLDELQLARKRRGALGDVDIAVLPGERKKAQTAEEEMQNITNDDDDSFLMNTISASVSLLKRAKQGKRVPWSL